MPIFKRLLSIFVAPLILMYPSVAYGCGMSLWMDRQTPLEDLQIQLKSSFGGQSPYLSLNNHRQLHKGKTIYQRYQFLLPPPFCSTLDTVVVRYTCEFGDLPETHDYYPSKTAEEREIFLQDICQ